MTHGSQNSSNQELDIVDDIRCIFESDLGNPIIRNMATPWLDDIYKALNFSYINRDHHNIPKD